MAALFWPDALLSLPGGELVSSASTGTTLELWASSLREKMAAPAGQFRDGLLGLERRKTGWMAGRGGG
jgi:hypothetical protein